MVKTSINRRGDCRSGHNGQILIRLISLKKRSGIALTLGHHAEEREGNDPEKNKSAHTSFAEQVVDFN